MIYKKEKIRITNVDWNPNSWAREHIGKTFIGFRVKYPPTNFKWVPNDGTEWWYRVGEHLYLHPSMCGVVSVEPIRCIKKHKLTTN